MCGPLEDDKRNRACEMFCRPEQRRSMTTSRARDEYRSKAPNGITINKSNNLEQPSSIKRLLRPRSSKSDRGSGYGKAEQLTGARARSSFRQNRARDRTGRERDAIASIHPTGMPDPPKWGVSSDSWITWKNIWFRGFR